MSQGIPVYTLHGSLLLEISQQRNLIGVLLLPLQLNLTKIGVSSIQTTRQYPRRQRTGDSYFQTSTTFRLVVNIIQTEITFSTGESKLVVDTGDITGIATLPTFRRSRYCVCDSIRVFWYHWYCYLQRCLQLQWCKLVQSAVQHTSSVLRVNLQLVVLVMNLLHHSYQKDLVHYSNLVVQNPAQRHTYVGDYHIFW